MAGGNGGRILEFFRRNSLIGVYAIGFVGLHVFWAQLQDIPQLVDQSKKTELNFGMFWVRE